MSSLSTNHLALPLMAAAQAQKHVTHNDALLRLDAIVQLSVLDSTLTEAPVSPADGDRYIVGAGATGDWAGHDGAIAAYVDGAWLIVQPAEGWIVFDQDADAVLVYRSASWQPVGSFLGAVDKLGINTTADTTNRLAVRSEAVLLSGIDASSGGTGDSRVLVNKETDTDTGSVVFQSGFSGRAEIGLAGDADFTIKVSDDGSAWIEAMRIDPATGLASLLYDNATSGLAATTVEDAVDELAGGKAPTASPDFTGTVALHDNDGVLEVGNGAGSISGTGSIKIDRGNGFITMGLDTPRTNFKSLFGGSATPAFQRFAGSAASAGFAFIGDIGSGNSPGFWIAKGRGSGAIVEDGDRLADYGFMGSDGTNYIMGASIAAFVDGTPDTDDMPTCLSFRTNGGSDSPTERMKIAPSGAIYLYDIGTGSGNSLVISGDQVLEDTSTERYKADIEPLAEDRADAFMQAVEPIWYRSTSPADVLPDGTAKTLYSFSAEKLAAIDPRLANWGYAPEDYEMVETAEENEVEETELVTVTGADGNPVLGDDGKPQTVERLVRRIERSVRSDRVLKEGAELKPRGVNDRAIIAMLTRLLQRLEGRVSRLEG